MLAYSALLGGLQHIVPGREAHLADMVTNIVGVTLGLTIVALWRHARDAEWY